jgi:hypothetical protein
MSPDNYLEILASYNGHSASSFAGLLVGYLNVTRLFMHSTQVFQPSRMAVAWYDDTRLPHTLRDVDPSAPDPYRTEGCLPCPLAKLGRMPDSSLNPLVTSPIPMSNLSLVRTDQTLLDFN